ncbi:hypothetical protein ACHAQK_012071, partial [Fusarium lateritium]
PAAGPIIVELLNRKDLGEADVLAAFLPDLFTSTISKLNSSGSSLPRAFIPIETLPLTTSGKVSRRALQDAASSLSRSHLFSFNTSFDIDSHEQDTVIEADQDGLLAQLWENVLGIKVNGRQSNFFRLGGNSMAAIALRAEARQAGFQLFVAEILAKSTLGDIERQ